ncbi:hypothetical protein L6452_38322 [Arctium lappa]|uniref:Uncharacterized protein n=1 Tax=Arctium lappa TaxID=4217 RepID=A0ACB8Y4S5_ARCLA|nr:hypothetical protein L6452_38322 [Arctium lappa]
MVKFGKPKKTTRVGIAYQAIIPSVMEKYEPPELMRYGLPIPVTWVRNDQPKTNNEEAIESNNNAGEPDNDNLLPLPGLSTETWSAIERGSFLLGLYFFAKNFRLVERFMGSKEIGSISGYYYGEFYKSGDYNRWTKWRMDRCTRPLNARKLFIGWSYQELMSRLSSNATEESKVRLIRDGTKYIEGRQSLTRFVFALKQNVGMDHLVEAVAIGQEDRDLLEFRPINDQPNVNLEVVPINNPGSSLTPQEIVRTLNGDGRLSKARSSDLFWDEVWPRLLARGWHSEKPRHNVVENSNNFVFLVPGVDEFSRNELKKGIHYFDSLTDVLSKVASEPELLELESDHRDESVDSDTNQDLNREEHQDDLEPDVRETNQDSNMFTIVDASSDRDKDGIVKLMELPTYMVEKGAPEREINESCINNNLANDLDRKSIESYNESNPVDDTGENIGFQEKTPSGNGEREEIVEEPCSKNEHEQQIVIDLDVYQTVPYTDPDRSSLSPIPIANQVEFSNAAGSANMQQQPVVVPQRRYSTRSRMLSTKALEALAFGDLSPKKKRKGAEEKTPRRVRGKTDAVSSGGAGNVENAVDGAFGGAIDTVDDF